MNFAAYTRSTQNGLSIEISAKVHQMMQAFSDYMIFRDTMRKLAELDDASLADLGMHRSGIRAEARKAVYGV